MAIVSIPADLSKGADPSPWTLNGDDLYTDSTSYLVGIGLTDPDVALHVKDAANPQFKLDDGSNYHAFESTGGKLYVYRDDVDTSSNDYLELSRNQMFLKTTDTNCRIRMERVGDGALEIVSTDGGGQSYLQNSNKPLGIKNGFRLEYITNSSASISVGKTSGTFVMCTLDGAQTVNLPSVNTWDDGLLYYIKDAAGTAGFKDGSGTLTKTITINPHSGGTIDGGASIDIDANYGSVMLVTDGSNNWFVI